MYDIVYFMELEFLKVREAARRLHVHENTVRNMVDRGELQDYRLPGSRFLRLRADEVDKLVARQAKPKSSIQSERRALNPEFVGASQLKQWPEARQRDAQGTFPELVRRLLVETPGITNISIRAGDGVALNGYDGTADSAGTSFLPAGRLVFEFGTNQNPSGKATDDYYDRIEDRSASPSETFVFVTPRRWGGKSSWEAKRKQEGHFADVKAVDADDLEGWLHTAPAAHHWISEHLGLRPRDAVSLDGWLRRFNAQTNPALPPDLFLAGRARQAAQLSERLNSSPTVTVIEAQWTDDCLAFLRAAIADVSNGLEISPALMVTSVQAWDAILEKPGLAILIPQFDGADVAQAVRAGHHVISIVDRAAASLRPADISLPRLDRSEAADALRAVGLEFNRADRLAALGRRSLPALLRELSPDPRISRPDWSRAPDGPILAALLLVGRWTSNPADVETLEAVTNQPWQALRSFLDRMTDSADPVLHAVGGLWSFTWPEEAFSLLRSWLKNDVLQRFAEVAVRELSELGPQSREAATATIDRASQVRLRSGLAQGLALLGVMGTEVDLGDGTAASDVAARTVRHLLLKACGDTTCEVWHQLAEVLPLLAEAAPNVFIDTLDDDLRASEPTVVRLFIGERDAVFHVGPSSPRTDLLWALETICWSADHLIDGVRILARLASVDPGGKSSNRPAESLRSILAGFTRHTTASLDEKFQALDAAYRVAPDVAWKLNMDLWPGSNGLIVSPVGPRFRDWKPDHPDVSMAEWIEFTHRLVDRAIANVGAGADRLGQVANGISAVPPDDRERIIRFLEERVHRETLDEVSRFDLWERLHALVARHRRFASADWALPSEMVDRLSKLVTVLEQQPDPRRSAYLFDWHPDLPGVDQQNYQAFQAELNRLRTEALQSVLEMTSSIDELASLARRVPSPELLGSALGVLDEVELPQLIPWLASTDTALIATSSAWARRRLEIGGAAWLSAALLEPNLQGVAREILIRHAPPTREIWRAFHANSSDEETYWRLASFETVPLTDADEALNQLIRHHRAWDAVAVASNAIGYAQAGSGTSGDRVDLTEATRYLPAERVLQVLNAALTQPLTNSELSAATGFHVGQLIDYLARDSDLEETVAFYELAFFRLLVEQREPRALYRVLATKPEQFVELATHVYRGRHEPRRDLTDAEQNIATLAAWVLEEWNGFPGCREDRSLDAQLMASWVQAARLAFSENDRYDVGDELIGQSLARSPVGDDGAWPSEPVRDLLETIGSPYIERGLILGRINGRGITWRGIYEGGRQERDLANQYRQWSQLVRPSWPRAARVLRELSDSYERDARREDIEADLSADGRF